MAVSRGDQDDESRRPQRLTAVVRDVIRATDRCGACSRPLGSGPVFQFHEGGGPRLRCWVCALRHRPLLRRSLLISLVVGSLLLAINHGDAIVGGHWDTALAWKAPLTYLVPFVVATWGALLNSRLSGSGE